ncbi:hypothetical protein O1G22_43565 (plasmid) [Streptomyces camelliae]|uniref:Uncharacterized protein n=1 Tax=Streptomyces camelliae TaxID=3004093 RepID=A0ABY7PIR4_9ACTN|nr:hypothetical protein [Streptomyces sp. HUAS 2-6]WBO69625.1 hypothetical protein O1G22_43565 [Streptomyces sp. HUAS 2-6]
MIETNSRPAVHEVMMFSAGMARRPLVPPTARATEAMPAPAARPALLAALTIAFQRSSAVQSVTCSLTKTGQAAQ